MVEMRREQAIGLQRPVDRDLMNAFSLGFFLLHVAAIIFRLHHSICHVCMLCAHALASAYSDLFVGAGQSCRWIFCVHSFFCYSPFSSGASVNYKAFLPVEVSRKRRATAIGVSCFVFRLAQRCVVPIPPSADVPLVAPREGLCRCVRFG